MMRCFKNNCSELQRNVLPLYTVILVRKEREGLYFSPDSSAALEERGISTVFESQRSSKAQGKNAQKYQCQLQKIMTRNL